MWWAGDEESMHSGATGYRPWAGHVRVCGASMDGPADGVRRRWGSLAHCRGHPRTLVRCRGETVP